MLFTAKTLAALAAAASLTSALPTKQSKRSFSPGASNNVAVWWGNSPATEAYGLDKVCADDSVDIVILTFATAISGGKVTVAGGADSTTLGSTIKQCQSSGKKVFMSLGGATGQITFASASDAKTAADAVASNFLTTGSANSYGVALDGIDIDNETGKSANWDAFVTELRTKMTKDQYISGAPQCPFPDASLDTTTLNEMDYVWVQFYNNGPCNHGASGFSASVQQWSKALTKPKLYIATPGSQASAGSGYIDASAMASEISSVKAMNLPNLGGYAIWDGSTAAQNSNYQQAIKKALGGSTSGSGPASASAPASGPTSAAPTAGPTGGASASKPATAPTTTPLNKGEGGAVTVQATSTAVVTSTVHATGAAPTDAAPTGGASPSGVAAPSGSAAPSASTPATAAPTGGAGGAGGATQSCSSAGTIVCSSDGKQFGICDGSSATMMTVSGGTTCANGAITAVSSS